MATDTDCVPFFTSSVAVVCSDWAPTSLARAAGNETLWSCFVIGDIAPSGDAVTKTTEYSPTIFSPSGRYVRSEGKVIVTGTLYVPPSDASAAPAATFTAKSPVIPS